jgi:glycine/D-amino acid oxidase-like deaminating enzyme
MGIAGIAAGAIGAWGLSYGLSRFGRESAQPPHLYEYFLDNYWFKTAGYENQALNPPLKGTRRADIVILGGGFTGLAAAYHLIRQFPDRKIVLLEGACCGYGASGRNGGFVDTRVPGWSRYYKAAGPEKGRRAFDLGRYGIHLIKQMVDEHGLDCEFEENGSLVTAMNEKQIRALESDCRNYKAMGLDASVVQGKELETHIKSPRYIAGLTFPYTGILNPYKLARGMKALVEGMGVEILERTVVMRFTPGRMHRVDTEMGAIEAPDIVLGLNGYSAKLGLFKNRVIPVCSYVIATEPLSPSQWEAIGWRNRQGISDMRATFNYLRPTADGRIVIGGTDYPYYAEDGLSSGNNKPVIAALTRDLFDTFPQLEGVRIEHAWGGTMGFSYDFTPSVGQMGEYKNIYFGVAHNGEGVGNCQTAGRIIADLMAAKSSELTKLYYVNHKIPWAGPQKLRVLPARFFRWYAKRWGIMSH